MGSSRPTDYIYAELKMAIAEKHTELAEALGAAMMGIETRDKELFARQTELNETHEDLTHARRELQAVEAKFMAHKEELKLNRASLAEKSLELDEARALLKKADRTMASYFKKLKIAQERPNSSGHKPSETAISSLEALRIKLEGKVSDRDGTVEYLTAKLGQVSKQCASLETQLAQYKTSPKATRQASSPDEVSLAERLEKAEADVAMLENVNDLLRHKLSVVSGTDGQCETVQRLFASKA